MELRVLGCHGGETTRHRCTSFLVDGRVCLDAGAITGALELEGQLALETVLVSHAHLDHVRDLATLADNRCQAATKSLRVVGTAATIQSLRQHLFNGQLWPDFAKIPLVQGTAPTLEWVVLEPEVPVTLGDYEVVPVLMNHSIECSGFVLRRDGRSLAFSGDTSATTRFWEILSAESALKAILLEVSFPDALAELAQRTGHHTPTSLQAEMPKLQGHHDCHRMPFLIHHLKPATQRETERELARITGFELDIVSLGDRFVL